MDSTHDIPVTFLPAGRTVYGSRGDTLLDVALDNGIELAHTCGGNCGCTTCHVIVLEGAEHLSPMEEPEDERLGFSDYRTAASRLACQALLRGPGPVVVEEESRECCGSS